MRNNVGDYVPESYYLHVDENGMMDEAFLKTLMPIGYLKHDPTGYTISVYKPISRFKRIMLRWAFGLKYKPIK